MWGGDTRTKFDFSAGRVKWNVKHRCDFNREVVGRVERVIPQRNSIGTYLIGVDQRMIQLLSIVKGFI